MPTFCVSLLMIDEGRSLFSSRTADRLSIMPSEEIFADRKENSNCLVKLCGEKLEL